MQLEQRVELIVDLVGRYKGGANLEQVKREAKAVFAHVRPDEMAAAERELAAKRIDPGDLRELHRLHLANLHHELTQFRESLEPWHPIRTMIEEHDRILQNLEELERLNSEIQDANSPDREVLRKLASVAANLLAAEHHHLREEEVVFPELTKGGIGMTVEAMESEHNELRERKHLLADLAGQGMLMDFGEFKADLDEVAQYIIYNLSDHIHKENHIMFPAALRMVKDGELWKDLKRRCDAIGYCDFSPLH